MRFRLTLFLLILNAALFFGIWSLERSDSEGGDKPHASIAFSVLQIEGKNIEKPRILKLENNRWRIACGGYDHSIYRTGNYFVWGVLRCRLVQH